MGIRADWSVAGAGTIVSQLERDAMMTTVHTPCPNCDMDTRDECGSWDHMRVDGLVMLRMADAFRGRVVPRWVVDLIADECFADSPAFDRHRFLIRCGVAS